MKATLAVLFMLAMSAPESDPPKTVPAVDLDRYLGKWYEIARYPNRFERKCDRDVTATYSRESDRKIRVLNACVQSDGKRKEAKGTAKPVDASNARLKVTFFWPFRGDYWVLGLGADYEYAVVGEPKRKYLWILSRTPKMSPGLYEQALQTAKAAGYDTSRLMVVKHTTE